MTSKFKVLRSGDLSSLWRDVVRWHLYKEKVDLYLSIGTNLENVILEAQSMAYDDFDMGRDLWLTPARWTMLMRDYLVPSETRDFVKRSRQILTDKGKSGVITNMAFRGVTRRTDRHRWGNCLLGVTFRGCDVGKSDVYPTMVFHSRVSYNAYIMGLDMAIGHVLAREITQGEPERIRFQWHLDVVQLHGFKCLPYLYSQPDLMAVLTDSKQGIDDAGFRNEYPTWRCIGRWWDAVRKHEDEGKTLDEELYGPYRRIRRRYQEYLDGKFQPSVKATDLTFDKLEGYKV
jgi:hypothetical protein